MIKPSKLRWYVTDVICELFESTLVGYNSTMFRCYKNVWDFKKGVGVRRELVLKSAQPTPSIIAATIAASLIILNQDEAKQNVLRNIWAQHCLISKKWTANYVVRAVTSLKIFPLTFTEHMTFTFDVAGSSEMTSTRTSPSRLYNKKQLFHC